MPRHGTPPQERARSVLKVIDERGGVGALPQVLGPREVRPLMGQTWFGDTLRLGVLPGVQLQRGGTWRCDRDTFLLWLREVAAGTAANMAMACTGLPDHARAIPGAVDSTERGG